MPVVEARIDTDRPSRYLVQFCKHAAAMAGGGHTARLHLRGGGAGHGVQVAAQWSDTHGTVTFTPWGVCTLTADAGLLTVRIDAASDDGLARIRDIVSRDLERFTRRNPVTVAWQPSADTGTSAPDHDAGTPVRRWRPTVQIGLLALAVVLVVGVHLGLAGTMVAGWRWTAIGTNVIVGLVALKILLVVLGRRGIRRRRH